MKNEKFAATLSVGDAAYTYYPVEQVEGSEKLPYALKVLLENVLRNAESPEAASDLAKRVIEAGCAGEAARSSSAPRACCSRTSRACRCSWTSP